jgi:hypothetical protein
MNELLTQYERARLRPTVDPVALEHFFAAAPLGLRRFAYLACVDQLISGELTELGLECALPPRKLRRALGGLFDEPLVPLWAQVEPPGARGA